MLNFLPHFRYLILFPFLQIFLFVYSPAQDALDTTGMRQQVRREAELFLKAGFAEDYNTVIKHLHPQQIEISGGEKNLLRQLKAGSRLRDKAGFSAAQFSFTLPEELVVEDNTIQCAFRYTLHLPKTDFSEAQPHHSTMIAISEDAGKNWYFLDANNVPIDRLTMLFSFINPNLNFPFAPEVQVQFDALNWELKPFIRGKEILNFNRKEQRITFSVPENITSSRTGLISTEGKVLLKPELMGVEDQDSLVFIYSEDNIKGSIVKPGHWDQLLPVPNAFEYIDAIKDRQKQNQLSGLHYRKVGENQYHIVNKDGKLIVQLEADQAPKFTKQFIRYTQNERDGLMSLQGKVLIKPEKYAQLQLSTEGVVQLIVAQVADADEYILVDTLGNPIGKNEGLSHIEPYHGLPYFRISKQTNGESGTGFMDSSGKIIVQPLYPYSISLNRAAYTLPKGEKWEVKSIKNHQPLFAGRTFDGIHLVEDYIIVSDHEKETVEVYSNELVKKMSLNLEDDIVAQAEVMKINGKEVLFLETLTGKYGYNLDGKPIFPDVSFKDIIPSGLIFIQKGKMGLITVEGKTLIPAVLDEIEYLEDSQSLWGKTNGKWGLLKL